MAIIDVWIRGIGVLDLEENMRRFMSEETWTYKKGMSPYKYVSFHLGILLELQYLLRKD
jgi:hypothetical protein